MDSGDGGALDWGRVQDEDEVERRLLVVWGDDDAKLLAVIGVSKRVTILGTWFLSNS